MKPDTRLHLKYQAYFLDASHLVPSLIALIAAWTLEASATSITTSLVLLLASTTLTPSTFDKARFTFLTQPPQVIFGTDSVTFFASAVTNGAESNAAALTAVPKSTARTTIADFNIF